MIRKNTYILIHSPLVGPLTWSLVADELRSRGQDVIVSVLADSPDSPEPFWRQHAESVGCAADGLPGDTAVTLVGHSGAGPLLPAIRQILANPVHAYVFFDAGIPGAGATRLDLMHSEDRAWAAGFEQELRQGALYPTWSFEDLQEVIPNDVLRGQMITELHPRGLDFFTEPIPVFEGWPDAPCIYIQCSPAYDQPAAQAWQAGWIVEELKVGHFHMLVDPIGVTTTILNTVQKIP